jgi:hypothetical protein
MKAIIFIVWIICQAVAEIKQKGNVHAKSFYSVSKTFLVYETQTVLNTI